MEWLDVIAMVFLIFNVLFLMGTAFWFRIDHSRDKSQRLVKYDNMARKEDHMWQYSLRSNLLLCVCILCSYLIYLQHFTFLIVFFTVGGIMNVLTDIVFQYKAPLFGIAKKGHLVTFIVTSLFAILYLYVKYSNKSRVGY
jgi:hypothetical protein